MTTMASQITSLTLVCSTVYSGADQMNYQSSASLAFVRGIHRWSVNSPHKGPVTQTFFHLMTSSCILPHFFYQIMLIPLPAITWWQTTLLHNDVIKWKHFPVTDGFPSQRPVTRSFDVFFDLRLNKRLSKQSRRRWFETPSHDNDVMMWSLYTSFTVHAKCFQEFDLKSSLKRYNITPRDWRQRNEAE